MLCFEGKTLSVLFGSFLKESPKLAPARAGSTRKFSFPGDSCFSCLSLLRFASVLLRFGVCIRRFPQETVFFCRPLFFAAFCSPFSGANFGFGWCVGFCSGWCCVCPCFWTLLRYGLPKRCRENPLSVRSLPFRLSLLALLLVLPGAGRGGGVFLHTPLPPRPARRRRWFQALFFSFFPFSLSGCLSA